ncbi:hypothetical protein [Roseicyclus marinus]|uniref:hypothetical protein n=1 Tax=Roseicyclus marinus TaxID=2161673 RepID=UPI00240ED3BF|nr:hypothetical protein [Roseicyclus marinus]MDG3042791.1 hypothetical protein [Roseicyclus marinus]
MNKNIQVDLFISMLAEEVEAYRTNGEPGSPQVVNVFAKHHAKLPKVERVKSAESPEPLDCFELMLTGKKWRDDQ